MSVLTDSFQAFSASYPEALGAWFALCILPLVSCALWTVRYFSHLKNPARAFFKALAYSFGYPTALLGLIIAPIAAFNIFLAPALIEAYPSWRSELLGLLALPNWLTAQSFWLAPLAWLLWLTLAPRHVLLSQKMGVK